MPSAVSTSRPGPAALATRAQTCTLHTHGSLEGTPLQFCTCRPWVRAENWARPGKGVQLDPKPFRDLPCWPPPWDPWSHFAKLTGEGRDVIKGPIS